MGQINALDLPTPGDESSRDVWGAKINTALDAIVVAHNATDTSAGGKYVKPGPGIPKSDMTTAVQASLGKADTALQSVPNGYASTDDVAAAVAGVTAASIGAATTSQVSAKYTKPGGGIPATDLAGAVQAGLVQVVTQAAYDAGPKTAGVVYVVTP